MVLSDVTSFSTSKYLTTLNISDIFDSKYVNN